MIRSMYLVVVNYTLPWRVFLRSLYSRSLTTADTNSLERVYATCLAGAVRNPGAA